MEDFSVASIDPTLLDLKAWPGVNSGVLSEAKRIKFEKRKQAIEKLILGKSDQELQTECGVSRRMAVYFLKRALKLHPDGRIYGFRILVQHSRLEPYNRVAEVPPGWNFSQSGLSGAFGKLLREHPDLQDMLDRHILKLGGNKYIYESRVKLKSLHKRLLDRCRDYGLAKGNQYPFNTKTLAHRSLSDYIHRTIKENINRAVIANLGSAALTTFKTGDGTNRPPHQPFQRVEVDAHKIDAIWTILIPSIFGNAIAKVTDRLWILTAKECASGTILAHLRSSRTEINSDDVLDLVAKALRTWKPLDLRIPTLKYKNGSGYPANIDTRFERACWKETSVDGSLAETCKRVKSLIKSAVGTDTLTLHRHNPNDRPYIESFFGLLEQNNFHRLPNTTGSGPTDSVRKNPEKVAIKYQMQVEHLDELLCVMHANYNCTPQTVLGGRTPLEYLQYLCESTGQWPVQTDPEKIDSLLVIRRKVIVRGDISQGRRPHINYGGGVKYTNSVLRQAVGLIGKAIVIEIPRDIRTVLAYTEDGGSLGPLSAAPPWNRVPHTLEIRRAIQAHQRKARMQDYVENSDPVIDYANYLEETARTGRGVSPIYLAMRKMMTNDFNVSDNDEANSLHGSGAGDSGDVELHNMEPVAVKPASKSITLERLMRKAING